LYALHKNPIHSFPSNLAVRWTDSQ